VTPAGQAEQLVGKDYAFRTEQRMVDKLDHMGYRVYPLGKNTIRHFRVTLSHTSSK
jgi:hypothetical protein